MNDRAALRIRAARGALLLLLLSATQASGQSEGVPATAELALKRDAPAAPSQICEAQQLSFGSFASPDPRSAARAERLASDANQADILGEPGRAHELLRQATVLDRSSSTISYRFARLLESEGETEAALAEYCRSVALEPTAEWIEDVKSRIRRLGTGGAPTVPDGAREAMSEGIRAMDAGDHQEAIRRFSLALVEHPDWDAAHYNRALAYLAAGRTAAGGADLEWYLQVSPEAPDRAAVEARLASLRGEADIPHPRTALLAGLLVPGLGHYYSDRPMWGTLTLAAAGAAVGVGMLYREIDIRCRSLSPSGDCSAGQVTSRSEDRPLLVPGLVTAGAVTVISAVHAYLGTRRDRFRVSPGGGLEASFGTVDSRESVLTLEPRVRDGTVGLRTSLVFRF